MEGVVKRAAQAEGREARRSTEDGTIVRMSPHAAKSPRDKLATGHKLAARGASLTNALGTVIDAHGIGLSLFALHPLERKRPDEHREAQALRA